jgi:hypothetical protein
MKFLACASYDYMKLIVLELQHQLSELEEAERLASASAAEADDASDTTCNGSVVVASSQQEQQPKAPPRMRSNPFGGGLDNRSAAAATKKTWLGLHRDFGSKISSDREAWHSIDSAKGGGKEEAAVKA